MNIILKHTKLVFLLFIGFLSVNSVKADMPYAISNIPDSLSQNANSVIRKDINYIDIKSKKEYTHERELAVSIFNRKSSYDVYFQHYHQQYGKIISLTASIYDAKGNLVRKIDKKEIKDESAVSSFSIYEDSRVKYIEINYGTYPYTVVYNCKYSSSNYIHLPGWRPREINTAVEEAYFNVKIHKDNSSKSIQDLRYSTNKIDQKPKVSDSSIYKSWEWKINQLQADQKESLGPNLYKILPSISIAPNDVQLDNWKGSLATWKSFGKFIYDLNEGKGKLSSEMKSKVKSLTASASNDEEKIQALYKYLQENMRYVSVQLGIGGYQTFDASYVEKNKYGDCKALTYFMRSILEEAGIKAYPALIDLSGKRRFYDEDFSYAAFNHVILNVPSEECWLECTSNHNPVNYIGEGNYNRNALLITEEGGKLVKTPTLDTKDNQKITNSKVTVSADGHAEIVSESVVSGTLQEIFRHLEFNYSKQEQTDWFLKSNKINSAKVNALVIKTNKDKPEGIFNFKASSSKYASKAGKRLFVPLNKINTFEYVPPKLKDRNLAVHLNRNYSKIDTISITLPEGYKVESLPEKQSKLESSFGEYSFDVELKDRTLIYTRKLVEKPAILPAEKFEEVRNFYKQIAKADGMKVVLVQTERP